MNCLLWLFAVFVIYEVQCQRYSDRVCRYGRPLARRTCGGMIPWRGLGRSPLQRPWRSPWRRTRRQCPRGYACVGEQLAWDGPGVCCPRRQATTHQLCPRTNPAFRVQCFRFEQCPRRGCPGRETCCSTYCGTRCIALRPPCGISSPARDSYGRMLYCGRGRSRMNCPTHHYCSTDPRNRYAVCCPYL